LVAGTVSDADACDGCGFVFNAPRLISAAAPLIAGTLIVGLGGYGKAATIIGLFISSGCSPCLSCPRPGESRCRKATRWRRRWALAPPPAEDLADVEPEGSGVDLRGRLLAPEPHPESQAIECGLSIADKVLAYQLCPDRQRGRRSRQHTFHADQSHQADLDVDDPPGDVVLKGTKSSTSGMGKSSATNRIAVSWCSRSLRRSGAWYSLQFGRASAPRWPCRPSDRCRPHAIAIALRGA
jgi:hypothetical protein